MGREAVAAVFASHFVRNVPQLLCTYRSSICAEDARSAQARRARHPRRSAICGRSTKCATSWSLRWSGPTPLALPPWWASHQI